MRAGILLFVCLAGCGDAGSIVGAAPDLQGGDPTQTPTETPAWDGVGPQPAPREIPAASESPPQNAFAPAPAVILEVAPPADPVTMWPTQPVWNEYWFSIDSQSRGLAPSASELDELVDPRPGMRIADIGAGGGYFTFRYANRVGPDGAVVAVDIDRRMTLRIAWEAQARRVSNVRSVWVPRGQMALEPASFDRVIFIDIGAFSTCQSEEGAGYLRQSAEALRPGGRLVIQHGLDYPGFPEGCASMSAEQMLELADGAFTLTERRVYRKHSSDDHTLESLVFTRQ